MASTSQACELSLEPRRCMRARPLFTPSGTSGMLASFKSEHGSSRAQAALAMAAWRALFCRPSLASVCDCCLTLLLLLLYPALATYLLHHYGPGCTLNIASPTSITRQPHTDRTLRFVSGLQLSQQPSTAHTPNLPRPSTRVLSGAGEPRSGR